MRTVLYVLAPMLLAAVGCFPNQVMKEPPKVSEPPAPVARKPLVMVTPEEVTNTNAHQMAQLLNEELEQARSEPPPPPEPEAPPEPSPKANQGRF